MFLEIRDIGGNILRGYIRRVVSAQVKVSREIETTILERLAAAATITSIELAVKTEQLDAFICAVGAQKVKDPEKGVHIVHARRIRTRVQPNVLATVMASGLLPQLEAHGVCGLKEEELKHIPELAAEPPDTMLKRVLKKTSRAFRDLVITASSIDHEIITWAHGIRDNREGDLPSVPTPRQLEKRIPKAWAKLAAGGGARLVFAIWQEVKQPRNTFQEMTFALHATLLIGGFRKMSLQGPPGCGKTASMILLLAFLMTEEPELILLWLVPQNEAANAAIIAINNYLSEGSSLKTKVGRLLATMLRENPEMIKEAVTKEAAKELPLLVSTYGMARECMAREEWRRIMRTTIKILDESQQNGSAEVIMADKYAIAWEGPPEFTVLLGDERQSEGGMPREFQRAVSEYTNRTGPGIKSQAVDYINSGDFLIQCEKDIIQRHPKLREPLMKEWGRFFQEYGKDTDGAVRTQEEKGRPVEVIATGLNPERNLGPEEALQFELVNAKLGGPRLWVCKSPKSTIVLLHVHLSKRREGTRPLPPHLAAKTWWIVVRPTKDTTQAARTVKELGKWMGTIESEDTWFGAEGIKEEEERLEGDPPRTRIGTRLYRPLW